MVAVDSLEEALHSPVGVVAAARMGSIPDSTLVGGGPVEEGSPVVAVLVVVVPE